MQNRSSLLNFKNQKNSEICTFVENRGFETGEQKGKAEILWHCRRLKVEIRQEISMKET